MRFTELIKDKSIMNHSIDKLRATVFNDYLPAANQGNPRAAKKCGDYFSLIEDYNNAIKYYEQYLEAFPYDKYVKTKVKWLKIMRVKNDLF